jgi:hypothetical protein
LGSGICYEQREVEQGIGTGAAVIWRNCNVSTGKAV